MNNLAEKLASYKVIPVVAIERVEDVVPLGKALSENGLDIIEITFRTTAATDAIALLRKELPEMYIGAGTVLDEEQVKQACEAGASFIVAPGFNPHTLQACRKYNIPFIPGVCTPSELEHARHQGIRLMKFFPAEAAGGVAMLKALSGPYKDVRFMPTGGVNEGNISQYLALPNTVACGGTWMVPQPLIEARNWQEIGRLTRKAVSVIIESGDK
ncbi:bifunctional 4-hydroxy-2-oxoglutarate aldolase/2-dehydro-3-deoxy-phosphogluconate aldolase [Vibrio splendidus]|uniref:bifunctional 4-hydroxy-2-oxoglutarate aldolase/2-dehydro-3-deoxy-phosphogluconate aldolase n=1 Tax=Vibrio splendidus TaxID=29497 RepID=UPI0011918243|nr:bifunctional 4-hydroxy-2-oxoglutarate aldolase/2-dehydro-3-deoxy-phosphogluconate aldolase [Vibrio atlanticus]